MAKKKAAPKRKPARPTAAVRAANRKKESTDEAALRKWCIEQGWQCRKLQDLGMEGYPDRTICFGFGFSCKVEMKRIGGKLRPTQVNYIEILQKEFEPVLVTDDINKAKAWILEQHANFTRMITSLRLDSSS